MPNVRWEANAQVTIGATATGTAIVNGPKPGQVVDLTRMQLMVTGSQRMSQCKVYKGNVNDFNVISTTATGNSDTDDNPNTTLYPGEFVTAVWTLIDVGAVASIYLTGVMTYGI